MKNHDMMDDAGEFAVARRVLYAPQGRPEHGWCVPASVNASMQHKGREHGAELNHSGHTRDELDSAMQPAEACTELGAEPTVTRRRLGPIGRIERALLQRRPTFTFAAIVGLALAAAAVRACGGAA